MEQEIVDQWRRLVKEKKEQDKLVESAIETVFRLAELVFVVASGPFAFLLRSWVACKLWHWFVVPLGVMELRVGFAAGILLIYKFIQPVQVGSKSKEKPVGKATGEVIFASFIAPLICLGLGWFIHWMTK